MIRSINELRETISKGNYINKEITNTLLEIDVLPSTGMQSSLNSMLVELYKRLENGEQIQFEKFADSYIQAKTFKDWVNAEFTNYSSKLFNETIER